MNFLSELTPGKALALITGGIVMMAVWVLNTVFTFTYGLDVIGPFLLLNQVGPTASAALSGLTAVLFYDLAYTVAFITLIFACSSVWQYAITGFQFMVTLGLSIAASSVSILLLSPLGNDAPAVLLEMTRYIGYAALVVGFVVNCLCTIGYIATSPRMSELIYQSTRSAGELSFMRSGMTHLDKESRNLARQQVNQAVPGLAREKALGLLEQYIAMIGKEPQQQLPANTSVIDQPQEKRPSSGKASKPRPKQNWRSWMPKKKAADRNTEANGPARPDNFRPDERPSQPEPNGAGAPDAGG